MIAKNFLLPILLSFGLGAPYFIAWAPAEGDPQKGKKGAEMPKQIQDKRKRQIDFLAYSPKLHQLTSVAGFYYFTPESAPSLPVDIWDLRSGELKHSLIAHTNNIRYIGFMPNGEKLVSAGLDGMVLWDLAKDGGDRGPSRRLPIGPY